MLLKENIMKSVLRFTLLLCILNIVVSFSPEVEVKPGEPKITRTVSHKDVKQLSMPNTNAVKVESAKMGQTTGLAPFIGNGIKHRRGPVMDSGANVYIVWYGDWNSSLQTTIVNFITSMGMDNAASPFSVKSWWNINSLYYNTAGTRISSNIRLINEVTDAYSLGKKIDFIGVATIIQNAMFSNVLPYDADGIYLVLSSGDVQVKHRKCLMLP